jgi:UDP-GlcNAc:undecaprenyl-phosphate GlcNAc-1-phosphate transferase
MESILIITFALITGLIATRLTKSVAIKYNIGTVPDQRKIHLGFIPHMGGLGIFLGGLSGLIVALIWKEYYWNMFTIKYAGILTGATIMLVTGIVDDTRGLQASQKFILQLVAATVVIYSGCKIDTIINPFGDPIQLGVFSIPITYLWLIGITNAINLLDGLDGLASGVGLIALTTFAILSFQHQDWMTFGICLAFIGGILGFLYFNYHPASIFMGDTGSLFLGFLIAALAVKGLQKSEGNISLLVPIIALAVPIGDTSLAFFRRIYQGHHPFSPDKDHLHHRLLFLGLSHRQAVHIIYLFSFLFGLAAILMSTETGLYGVLVVLLIFMTAILSLYRLGYLEAQKIKTYLGERTVIEVKKETVPLSMRRFWHKLILISTDVFMLNLALLITYFIRFKSGLFETISNLSLDFYFTSGIWLLLTSFFVLLFILNGLYSLRWEISRFDQVRRVSRVIAFGIIIFFIITLDPEKLLSPSRLNLFIYAFFLTILINIGRLFIIYIEKKFNVLEYAPHQTLLIGADAKARKLIDEINQNPHLLYNIVGIVSKTKPQSSINGLKYLGNYSKISSIIREKGIEEVIISLDEQSPDEVLNIVAHGENPRISFKVIPEMYDVISGLKTEEVIGHPLIKLFPEHMLPWQWLMKRFLDFILAGVSLLILSPLFLLVALIQMIGGIRPIFSIDDRVGRHGKIFGLVEFNRGDDDNKIGQLILTSRIYKLPQLINVVIGSLSLVGPRAETKETVENLRSKIRFYNRRFMIRPGMTGWAQLKVYKVVTDEMREDDFRQDLFYLENMSLIFDFRILIRALIKLIVRR